MDLIASRPFTYATRRLLPGEPFVANDRVALVLIAAKKATRALPETNAAQPEDDIAALRDEYEQVLGKRVFNGWDAVTLQAKIAAAKG